MRSIADIVIMVISMILLGLVIGWWSAAVVGLVSGILQRVTNTAKFLLGFIAGTIVWGGQALYLNQANESLLATRVGELFSMPDMGLVLVTGIFGAVIAGSSRYVGRVVHKAFATND